MQKLEIGIEVAPEHAFGRAFVEGVSAYAANHRNWKLKAIQQEDLNATLFRSCDGIIARLFGERTERLALSNRIPIVDIGYERPRKGIAQVCSDEAAAGRLAAELAISRTYRNFGYCGINAISYSDRCYAGYAKRISEAGFSVFKYTCPSKLAGQKVFDSGTPYKTPDAIILKRWLKSLPKPIVVFCCNDHRAYQVMTTALKAGFRIPEEIGILGCDNDTMLCSFAQTPISSIDPDAAKVGYTAARVLDALMQNLPKHKSHPPILIPPKGIVERDSTQFVPIEPKWLSDAILLVERELSAGVSAEDVFRISGHSPPHVEKVFKAKLRCSVQNYITGMRMRKATALLRTGNLSTKEIAAACGYASPQYFCRVFKTKFGTSPRQLP